MTVANVYQGSQLVAHLERHGAGIRLTFEPGVRLRNGWLATTLPHQTAEFPDLPPFFLNLLPEGERLIRLTAFSYIIGNGDLHAKNISVLWRDAVTLSPAYDVLSTLPYPFLERRMALRMLGKDDNLRSGDFIDFGKRYDIPEKATREMLTTLCKNVLGWIGRISEIGFDSTATENLQKDVTRRLGHLQ